MNLQESILRRRSRFGFAVLLLLLWNAVIFAVIHFFPVPYFVQYLYPFPVLESFLLLWTDASWLVSLLLILLSLLAWWLASRNHAIGRVLLIATQCILLAANAIITPLHQMNELGYLNLYGGREPIALGTVSLLGLTAAIYPIAVLILTNKWKPTIK